MTTLPRKWATDANYSSGIDSGTSPRVDPGVGISAQGFLPHEGVPAQHLNFKLGETIDYLHDLDAALALHDAAFDLKEDFTGVELDFDDQVFRCGSGVWTTDSTGGTISSSVDVIDSEANAPGIVRTATTAADPDNFVTVTYGTGGADADVHEQLHSGLFATPGSYVEFRFRLLFGSVDTAFSIGLYQTEVGGTDDARLIVVGDGTALYSLSRTGSEVPEPVIGVTPSNEWLRVRFKSVDALLDTTEIYDDAGVLLDTYTHESGILGTSTPLHFGWRIASASTLARFVDVDSFRVYVPLTR